MEGSTSSKLHRVLTRVSHLRGMEFACVGQGLRLLPGTADLGDERRLTLLLAPKHMTFDFDDIEALMCLFDHLSPDSRWAQRSLDETKPHFCGMDFVDITGLIRTEKTVTVEVEDPYLILPDCYGADRMLESVSDETVPMLRRTRLLFFGDVEELRLERLRLERVQRTQVAVTSDRVKHLVF